jgi:large conductance mechanosensitive channel protein
MRNCVTEFRAFLLRGNSIDLAVGIVIGVAFGALVNAFVNDLITPIIAAIFVIAEGHDRGQLEARHVRRRERHGRAGGELTAVFGG